MPSKEQEAKEFPKYLQKNRKQQYPHVPPKEQEATKFPHVRISSSIHLRLVGSVGPMLPTTKKGLRWIGSPWLMSPPAKKVLLWIGSPGAMASANMMTRLGALAYRLQWTAGGRQWWRGQHSRQKAPPQSRQNRTRIRCGAGG